MARSFQVGPWTVEPDLNAIIQNGKTAHLEPKAMEVLLRLAASAGQTVSKDEVLNSVWPDTFVGDDALSRAIYELRKAFDDDPHQPQFIQTIPKRGYRLIAKVKGPDGYSLSFRQPVLKSEPGQLHILSSQPTHRIWHALVGVIVLCAVIVITATTLLRKDRPPIKSIAVLPLQNLSGDPKQDYLADGIHEELTSTLARISSLSVTSRTSAQLYRNSQKSVRVIGKELGVDAVIEGSMRRSGDQIAITLQVIDTRQDRHVWGNTFQRDLSNVLQMESEIALAISRELDTALTPQERSTFTSARPVDPEAYELFQEGRYYMAQLTVDSVPKAISRFQQSITKDSHYAPSYAGLAEIYLMSPGRQLPGLNDRDALNKAEDAAARAVNLDPFSIEGHIALGNIRLARYRPKSAEREFRRALQIAPSSADANIAYASALVRIGRNQEAMLHAERARALDPVSPLMNFRLAWLYDWAGEHKRAREQLKRVIELNPNFSMAYYSMVMGDLLRGETRDVNCDDQRMQPAGRSPERLAFLTFCYGKTGRTRDATKMFRRLQSHPDFRNIYPRMLAHAYVGIGNRARAIETLQRAWRDREVPYFDEILFEPSDLDMEPRYEELKKQIRARYDEDL